MKTITKHYIDGAFVESHGRENTAHSSTLVAEVPGYAELQREVHDALRAQHPEWIEADGKSPTCDSYELRLAELLVSHRNEEVPSKRVPRLFPRARVACGFGVVPSNARSHRAACRLSPTTHPQNPRHPG